MAEPLRVDCRADFRYGERWLVRVTCPYCGYEHKHDAGAGRYPVLGEVAATCDLRDLAEHCSCVVPFGDKPAEVHDEGCPLVAFAVRFPSYRPVMTPAEFDWVLVQRDFA